MPAQTCPNERSSDWNWTNRSPPVKSQRSSPRCQLEIFIALTALQSFSSAFTIRKQKNVKKTQGLREDFSFFGQMCDFFFYE